MLKLPNHVGELIRALSAERFNEHTSAVSSAARATTREKRRKSTASLPPLIEKEET